MSLNVMKKLIGTDDDGLRLDRWFKRHYPAIAHGKLEKLLRTGQIRVDGGRVKASHRLEAGQELRIPPLGDEELKAEPKKTPVKIDPKKIDPNWQKELVGRILHKDKSVLVIDKPAGLAVQGGTKTDIHLDGLLDLLILDGKERPRLVHRLDRDTSGVLVLARTASAAAKLADSFKKRDAQKIYWALVHGLPKIRQGKIDMALEKRGGAKGERVMADEDGKNAVTYYSVIDAAARKVAFLALMPKTGRTHQLRAHCAELGTPILGDGKYGGAASRLGTDGIARNLHLHAKRIDIAHPDGGRLKVEAPVPPHFKAAFKILGLADNDGGEPFAGLKP